MASLSDVDWIFLVLAVLYLLEMLVWIRPGTIAYPSSWGSFESRRESRRLTGNENGELWAGGLAPFDTTLLIDSIPLSTSVQGVVAFVAAAPLCRDRPQQSGQIYRWSQLADVFASERTIRLADETVCHVGSKRAAARLAKRLREIANCDDADRHDAIEQWRSDRYSVTAAKNRWQDWCESTLAIRIGATLLFLWLCPIGVVLYYGQILAPLGQPVVFVYLGILFALWWLNALVAWMSHKYLYPKDRADRWRQILYSLLSPAVPLRLPDVLGRHLFGATHPLAVSAAVDSPKKFRYQAERILRDANFPRLPDEPPDLNEDARQIIRESRAADLRHLNDILKSRELDPHSCLAPPEFEDDTTLSYCPRCLQEFVIPYAVCEECGQRESAAV